MNSLEKQDRIRAMLMRYRDALHASSVLPTGNGDSRILTFPPEMNQALRELDRCLTVMRRLGNQQAAAGISLKTVRWHTIAWYVDVAHRPVPVMRLVTGKDGRKHWLTTDKLTVEEQRHRDARKPKAELGVQWLADEYQWDRVHLKAISEACGELLAA